MFYNHNFTLDVFVKEYDRLKSKGSLLTNFLLNFHDLQKNIEKKECELISYDNSMFLFIPSYSFRELYYFSTSEECLQSDLYVLVKDNLNQGDNSGVKIRLVTKNENTEKKLSSLFDSLGFEKKGKILRLQSGIGKRKGISEYLDILKEMVSSLPDNLKHVGYAEPGDEEKIQMLLLTEFDPVIDSVPELDEIAEDIKKQFIIVVKDDLNNVIALRYFSVSLGVCSLIYEVTDKKYRKTCVFLQIYIFFIEEQKKANKEFKKIYGWRNELKCNLLKFSKSMDESPDGTVISIFYKE